jgi:hypothetical protein
MEDNIHEQILNWLVSYKPLADWYFNINKAEEDTINVIPISGEQFTEKWIDGGGLCQYDFAINIFKSLGEMPHTTTRPDENVNDLFDVQQFMIWLREQESAHNYPDLGTDKTVQELIVLQNFPSTAGEDASIAKMTFPGRIIYIKEGE